MSCMLPPTPGESEKRGGTMERGGDLYLYRFVSLAVGLWMMACMGVSFAQQAQPPAASAEPAKAETPAAAPNLPAYFTATNDPQKPAWPDPTGGASGVWATPASDSK